MEFLSVTRIDIIYVIDGHFALIILVVGPGTMRVIEKHLHELFTPPHDRHHQRSCTWTGLCVDICIIVIKKFYASFLVTSPTREVQWRATKIILNLRIRTMVLKQIVHLRLWPINRH